jgi:hypothetical protein
VVVQERVARDRAQPVSDHDPAVASSRCFVNIPGV